MAKTRVVYIHGDEVMHWRWGWVARLKDELTALGYDTFFELFPDSIEARAKYWLPFLREHVKADENDVLLGWSCGTLAAMRLAEEKRVRGLVLVAPYYSTDIRQRGWTETPWHWDAIKSHAESVVVFHGDPDPYITRREFDEVVTALGAQRERIPGARHFADQGDFPELLAYFQTHATRWLR
jgi:predicted alpha/beta hydrolase family esterase